MAQPPQDPTQPAQPAQPPAAPPGPSWGQPAAPPPQQYAPPPQPAPGGWAQPAPAGAGWVQPTAVKGPVKMLGRIGGLVIALIAALWVLLGAIAVAGGAALKTWIDSLNTSADAGNAVGGFVAGLGIVILVLALIELVAGLAAAFGKDWGRIISIIYAFVFGVPLLLVTFSALTASRDAGVTTDATGGLIILLVHVVGYVFAAIVLMASWRGRATA